MSKYILIYDTGDMLFTNKKDAFKFATYLKKKGHRIDRLQTFHGMQSKTKPILVRNYR